MGINTGRVIGGGLLAGAVMNFVDFLVNGVWLAKRWEDAANALNTRLMDPATQTTSMIGWIATDFLLGLSIVWAVSHIAYFSFAFLDLFPANLVALVSAGGLVAALAGGYAGCSIYRE